MQQQRVIAVITRFNMIKSDENSNAQSWELEIACKNKKKIVILLQSVNNKR